MLQSIIKHFKLFLTRAPNILTKVEGFATGVHNAAAGIKLGAAYYILILAQLFIRIDFGLTFLWAVYLLFFMGFGFTNRVYSGLHENFHALAILEVGVFITLFLCFLAFFVPVRNSAS